MVPRARAQCGDSNRKFVPLHAPNEDSGRGRQWLRRPGFVESTGGHQLGVGRQQGSWCVVPVSCCDLCTSRLGQPCINFENERVRDLPFRGDVGCESARTNLRYFQSLDNSVEIAQ